MGVVVVNVVLDKGRRRLALRGRSKIPPLCRFWLGFSGGMVVQQAIVVLIV